MVLGGVCLERDLAALTVKKPRVLRPKRLNMTVVSTGPRKLDEALAAP